MIPKSRPDRNPDSTIHLLLFARWHRGVNAEQTRSGDDKIKEIAVRHDRRKLPRIDEDRPHGHASSQRQTRNLLAHVIHHVTTNLPPTLHFHDIRRTARLQQKVDLASPATSRRNAPESHCVRRTGLQSSVVWSVLYQKRAATATLFGHEIAFCGHNLFPARVLVHAPPAHGRAGARHAATTTRDVTSSVSQTDAERKTQTPDAGRFFAMR